MRAYKALTHGNKGELAFGVGMARTCESSVGRVCVRYALAFFAR
jgi:hypothetical protein